MNFEAYFPQASRYVRLVRVYLLVCMVAGSTGCVPVVLSTAVVAVSTHVVTDARGVRVQLDDQHIAFQLNSALRRAFIKANLMETSNVSVTVYQGVALLLGEVRTEGDRCFALKTVKDRGLARKIYNEVRIGPKLQPAQAVKDAQITAIAKTRLFSQSKVKTKLPKLVTENAELFLLAPSLSKREQNDWVDLMENIHDLRRIVFVDVA